MNNQDQEKLEHFVHRTLRALPDRKAPRTLEHRVLAALASRQALPWYRQDFRHWPLAARAGFMTLSGAIVASTFSVSLNSGLSLQRLTTQAESHVAPLRSAFSVLAQFASSCFERIPSLWVYGGLAFIAFAYLALFGASATAYRTLFAKR